MRQRITSFRWNSPRSALFVETDASAGNSILTYNQSSDGTISFAGSYLTGGNGATARRDRRPTRESGRTRAREQRREPHRGECRSDTVTVFAVDGTHLTAVQQISSGGLFPDSIATSGRSWQCSTRAARDRSPSSSGSTVDSSPWPGRSARSGSPTRRRQDFHNGPGQVSYTPNGQHLIITTKLSTNSYDVFSVGFNGALGALPMVTAADNALPFAFVFDAAGNVVATEASNSSVSTYRVNANGTLTLARHSQRSRCGALLDLRRERLLLRLERGQWDRQLVHRDLNRRTRARQHHCGDGPRGHD